MRRHLKGLLYSYLAAKLNRIFHRHGHGHYGHGHGHGHYGRGPGYGHHGYHGHYRFKGHYRKKRRRYW